jgi:hypothetical protein
MEDAECADLLSRGDPTDRNLLFLNALDQITISGCHRISPQPEFANLKVFDDTKKAIHMIVVRVR